jgi:drug/metabolite transporter (DMT)-like permease
MTQSPLHRSIVAGHLALVVAQVAFGLFPVIGTIVFRPGGISPLALGAWRVTGGSVALGGLALVLHGKRVLPAVTDLPRFVICSLLGVAINQGLFLLGLARSTPDNAALVMALIPVFTFAIATAVGQETFSGLRAVGVGVALAGLAPLLFADGFHSLGRHGIGNLLMAANALSYSTYLVMTKPLTRRYPPLVVIAWTYVFSLVALPLFVSGQKLLPDAGAWAAWWSVAYVVAFPTVLAYLLIVFALTRLRASTTGVYVYAQPLVTAVAAWLVFHERPTPTMLLAAASLFLGIWLVSRRPPAVTTC